QLGAVERALRHTGEPNNMSLGWWLNRNQDGSKPWTSVPADAFWGSGAGQQLLCVIPGLDLIIVRNGEEMDKATPHHEGLEKFIVGPVVAALENSEQAIESREAAPISVSPVFSSIQWAPVASIKRAAKGSDIWALTWDADGNLFGAYGDGNGF